jgi:hypothetical protein
VCACVRVCVCVPCPKEQFIRTCLRTCATFIEERNSRLLQAAVYGTYTHCRPVVLLLTSWRLAIGACAEKDGQNLADTLTKEVLPRIVQRVGTIMTRHTRDTRDTRDTHD